MKGLGRPQRLGAFHVRIPRSDAPPRSGIHADSGAVGVKASAAVVKVRSILVWLPPIEPGRFELRRVGEDSSGQDSKCDVRAVLPMVRQRRERVGSGGWTVRESDGANGGLADWGGGEGHSDGARDASLVQRRELHEEIVRGLAGGRARPPYTFPPSP